MGNFHPVAGQRAGTRSRVRNRKHPRRMYVIAIKDGKRTAIGLYYGQNSFGEPDVFASKRPARGLKEFAGLRGFPLHAIRLWLVHRDYTYEVIS